MFPCVQKIGRLPLNVITTKIRTNQVFTQLGVPINVTGTAQVGYTYILLVFLCRCDLFDIIMLCCFIFVTQEYTRLSNCPTIWFTSFGTGHSIVINMS